MYVCMYIYVYIYVYIRMPVKIRMCNLLHACIYVCMICMYMYACMYVYICEHIRTTCPAQRASDTHYHTRMHTYIHTYQQYTCIDTHYSSIRISTHGAHPHIHTWRSTHNSKKNPSENSSCQYAVVCLPLCVCTHTYHYM
jgi:hypothetical protein